MNVEDAIVEFATAAVIRWRDWHDDLPCQIDVHVDNAAVMGSFDSPSLRWNTQTHHYDQIGTGFRTQVQYSESGAASPGGDTSHRLGLGAARDCRDPVVQFLRN